MFLWIFIWSIVEKEVSEAEFQLLEQDEDVSLYSLWLISPKRQIQQIQRLLRLGHCESVRKRFFDGAFFALIKPVNSMFSWDV